jgi:DNA-binding CsgD family transcriptional regulator
MDKTGSAIIDFTEAAYDLEVSDEEWLPTVLRRGLAVLDRGLGVAGVEYGRPPEAGPVQLLRIHVASGPEDFPERHTAALAATPPEALRDQARPGQATTMSESTKAHPEALASYTSHVDYCKDVLGITAVDSTGVGVAIVAPLAEVTTLTPQEAERWQMLAAHLDAGHRLRRGLATRNVDDELGTPLPYNAEAIFDPQSFRISDAVGLAKERTATKKLREAAVAIDRARGQLRKKDPEKALEIWRALVQGRWSKVDWFDTDGRRFIVAIPNAPEVRDPRGLTERERQVVTYAAMGQTNKMIGYRLGLSRSRVSLLLRNGMRKLGVKTRAQLAGRVRELEALE